MLPNPYYTAKTEKWKIGFDESGGMRYNMLQLFTGLICFQQSFAQSVQRLSQLPDLILLVDIAAL